MAATESRVGRNKWVDPVIFAKPGVGAQVTVYPTDDDDEEGHIAFARVQRACPLCSEKPVVFGTKKKPNRKVGAPRQGARTAKLVCSECLNKRNDFDEYWTVHEASRGFAGSGQQDKRYDWDEESGREAYQVGAGRFSWVVPVVRSATARRSIRGTRDAFVVPGLHVISKRDPIVFDFH